MFVTRINENLQHLRSLVDGITAGTHKVAKTSSKPDLQVVPLAKIEELLGQYYDLVLKGQQNFWKITRYAYHPDEHVFYVLLGKANEPRSGSP